MGGLEGTTALVTGGGSGIGLAVARRLAGDGAAVTIAGRTEERLAAAIEEIGPGAQYVVTDITVESDVERAVATAAQPTGRLDAVVASAGGTTSAGPVTQLDVDAWRATMDLNATGTMLTLKHAARLMARAGSGSFVAISSLAAWSTHRWFGGYGPSKAAVDQLVRLAADELGASGVRVNCIRPGLIRTDLVAAVTIGGATLDDYVANTPLGRIGEVEDVAGLARFLVGPDSAWITGQVINVDGGQQLRRGPDYSQFFEPAFGADALRGVVE